MAEGAREQFRGYLAEAGELLVAAEGVSYEEAAQMVEREFSRSWEKADTRLSVAEIPGPGTDLPRLPRPV